MEFANKAKLRRSGITPPELFHAQHLYEPALSHRLQYEGSGAGHYGAFQRGTLQVHERDRSERRRRNLEIGGVEDHVHLLAKFKASVSVSDMLRLIKANSSKWANERMDGEFAWQEGYAAFSVSESQVVPVRRYIRNQVQHHRRQSYQEEFVALLERHGVDYDPRYLWD